MGELSSLNLGDLIRRYDLSSFVETGTGEGKGVKHALTFPDFARLYSCEIVKAQADLMRSLFSADQRVSVFTMNSVDFLNAVLPGLEGNVLFWLDAHFPGADLGLTKHDDSSFHDDIRTPLEIELHTIKNLRHGKDVIIIDDLILYMDQGKRAPPHVRPRQQFSSDQFYADLFADTHETEVILRDQFYALLRPRERL